MGDNGLQRTDEDELCAIHLRNRLEGRPGDPDAVRRLILSGGEVGRFHDPARPYLHPEDVDIALADDVDRFATVRRLGDDLKVDLVGEVLTQPGANDGVVVDDGDSDHGVVTRGVFELGIGIGV